MVYVGGESVSDHAPGYSRLQRLWIVVCHFSLRNCLYQKYASVAWLIIVNGTEGRMPGTKPPQRGLIPRQEETSVQERMNTSPMGSAGNSTMASVALPASMCNISHNLQGFEAPTAYGGTGYEVAHAQPQQNEHAQEFMQDDRQQQRGFVKKRLLPSEPSPHVIFLGLDPDFTEADVCRLLRFINTFHP